METYENIENFTSTEDVRIAILKNYKMVGINKSKELSELYNFIQHNRDRDISIVKEDERIYHLFKKWLGLYSIREMMHIIRSKTIDIVSSRFLEILRKEDLLGKTRLITKDPATHNLARKYL